MHFFGIRALISKDKVIVGRRHWISQEEHALDREISSNRHIVSVQFFFARQSLGLDGLTATGTSIPSRQAHFQHTKSSTISIQNYMST